MKSLFKKCCLIVILCFLQSCKKDDFESDDVGPIVEQDVSFLIHEIAALNTIKDVFISGQQICFHDSLFSLNTLNNGVVILIDTSSSIDSIKYKINFGTTLSLCKDGKYRSGIVEYSYKKNFFYTDSAHTVNVKLINYRTDTLLINGGQLITNKGNVEDTITWQFNSVFTITTNAAKSITCTGNHQIKLKNKSISFSNYRNPILFSLAQFGIYGGFSGKNINQINYNSSMSNDAEFGFYCRPDSIYSNLVVFTKGFINYKYGGLINQTNSYIFFGNGECDRTYMLKNQGYSVVSKFR